MRRELVEKLERPRVGWKQEQRTPPGAAGHEARAREGGGGAWFGRSWEGLTGLSVVDEMLLDRLRYDVERVAGLPVEVEPHLRQHAVGNLALQPPPPQPAACQCRRRSPSAPQRATETCDAPHLSGEMLLRETPALPVLDTGPGHRPAAVCGQPAGGGSGGGSSAACGRAHCPAGVAAGGGPHDLASERRASPPARCYRLGVAGALASIPPGPGAA